MNFGIRRQLHTEIAAQAAGMQGVNQPIIALLLVQQVSGWETYHGSASEYHTLYSIGKLNFNLYTIPLQSFIMSFHTIADMSRNFNMVKASSGVMESKILAWFKSG